MAIAWSKGGSASEKPLGWEYWKQREGLSEPVEEIVPVGKGKFGNIYDQFKGKVKSAFDFLQKKKTGYLKGVFHRDEIGDIDLVWGEASTNYSGKGLAHIYRKHVDTLNDFKSIEEANTIIEDVVKTGIVKEGKDNTWNIEKDNYRVVVARDDNGNWILTAFDYITPKKEKRKDSVTLGTADQTAEAESARAVAENLSEDKDTTISPNVNDSGGENDVPSVQEQVEIAESDVNTTPTEGQKEAGNYKKGHVKIGKFNITIEQPKGSVRSGVDANGNKWETEMQNTYGYIRGTEGVDGDHIDVFLSSDIDGWDGKDVFVVDQYNEDGSFDEHKVMLGFNEAEEAHKAYLSNYEKDWSQKHKNVVTAVSIESFEKWINQSHRKTKAFAEYKINKGEAEKVFGVEDVVKRVEEWSEKIDGNGIRVVTRIEDVDNARALEVLKEGKRVDGWYDVANDQVVIYAPNVKSAEDVDKTYVHEVVAHKGVRGFLGKHADEFFERVWKDVMSDAERSYFEKYEGVGDIKDDRKRRVAAADEYVAPWGEGESFAEAFDRLSRKKNVLNVEVQRMERKRAMGGDIDEGDE